MAPKATKKETNPMGSLLARLKDVGVTAESGGRAIQRASSGSLLLDTFIGGGLGRGFIHEFHGLENTGKTTMAVFAMIAALERGERVAYIKGERRVDLHYWQKLGMPIEVKGDSFECFLTDENGYSLFYIISGESLEDTFNAFKEITASKQFGLVVYDGITSVSPASERQTDLTKESRLGGSSKIITRALRQFSLEIEESGAVVIVINQVRDNTDAQSARYVKYTTPGGHGLKHAASLRLEFKRHEIDFADKERTEMRGIIFKCRIVKTSICDFTGATCRIQVNYDGENYAINELVEVYTLAKQMKLFLNQDGEPHKAGNAFFNGVKLGNGENQILAFLAENDEVYDALKDAIKNSSFVGDTDNDDSIEEDEEPLTEE